MAFSPYKYIKEFYNPDRLVLPAIRDQIINTIFRGGAATTAETLMDSQDYPFFDLWRMCINHFRYSFWETIRGELIVVPDMMSCLPPVCNIIFPDEYVHYGRHIKLRGIVTRYFEQGFDSTTELASTEMGSQLAGYQAFVAPTTDIQPLMGDIIKAECFGEEIAASKSKPKEKDATTPPPSDEDNEDPKFIAFRQIPLPEEFHYGANYYTGEGEALLRAGESMVEGNAGSSLNEESGYDSTENFNLREEYNNFHKLNVLYKYFLTRMQSQKTENIRLAFTPRLVPGLPCLLLSRTGRHILGLLTAMTHNIGADGNSETVVTVEYQYLYDDSTKRPIYLYRSRDAEVSKIAEKNKDVDGYMWKNYFILSNDFRDKYIGKSMYHDILCDDIPRSEYNVFANEFISKLGKDYSILGINNIYKTKK